MTDALTVVIPAYNRERTVAATVASVRACGVPAEVVVVDDGSKDRTVEVARGTGVTVVSQANGGPAAARNTGVAHASGDVLAFLDSDDVWLPGTAAAALQALRDHPDLDAVFCETHFGNAADGYRPLSPITAGGCFGELLTDPIGPDLYRLDRGRFVRLMLDRNQVFLGSTLIRRAALDRLGLFDPRLFGGEDYELCLRLAAGAKWGFLARPLAQYEKHPGGLSADPDRMAREFALALRDAAARPDLFTPAEYALVKRRHRELSFYHGYVAYQRGDLGAARGRFAAALRHGGFSPKAAAYWLVCCLPGGVVRSLRRLKGAAP
ncbi:glycosyltransferase family 2 protein [Urbifossiella limnaea]|uniref:Putative glycosyltransferase EpsJ n=1 Tax=Urbifossiella limnaea TaxID=2528023 RepID=A0A517XMF4_9BACT|nr:glycosyltransferase [Urbifossiella limnaea]QDU18681.1 putative glycosyltransferase EpsJ [Urbifossiella limnaea]